MTFHHSNGRNQRPKGSKVKQAFQFAFILGVCIWLLYQIRHSNQKGKDFDARIPNKLSKEYRALILGRKGNADSTYGGEAWSDGRNLVQGENKENCGRGDVESDSNAEEKLVTSHKERETEDKPVTQGKGGQRNEENGSDIQGRVVAEEAMDSDKVMSKEESSGNIQGDPQESVNNYKEQKYKEETEIQPKEPHYNKEDITNFQVRDAEEELGSGKDEEPKMGEKEIRLQTNETGSASVPSQSDAGNGVHGFDDENGIPQDGLDLKNS